MIMISYRTLEKYILVPLLCSITWQIDYTLRLSTVLIVQTNDYHRVTIQLLLRFLGYCSVQCETSFFYYEGGITLQTVFDEEIRVTQGVCNTLLTTILLLLYVCTTYVYIASYDGRNRLLLLSDGQQRQRED